MTATNSDRAANMGFRILVPAKRVPDTDQLIRVREDGLGIEKAQLPFVFNPFDAIALEEALRIGEQQEHVEVLAVGIGGEDYEDELRTAMAMGADRALRIDSPGPLDPWNVARVLAAVVTHESPDLVLMGKQAVDDDSNQAGQFLAALLDWPQATFASKIEIEQNSARVSRETDLGIETVQVTLPAVITADLRLNEPRYASLPGILAARKKPIEQKSLTELDITVEPRVELLGLEAVSSNRSCTIVKDVDQLLGHLRDDEEIL